MAASKEVDVEMTERTLDKKALADSQAADQALKDMIAKYMKGADTQKDMGNEFSEVARNLRNANRRCITAAKPETRRALIKEQRKSQCEKLTNSTPQDWGLFFVYFIGLHGITAALFVVGLLLVRATAHDDGILWTWFGLEAFFACLLIYGIKVAMAKKLADQAAAKAAEIEAGGE